LVFVSKCLAADHEPPQLVFHSISVSLDVSGGHTLTPDEIARIILGSSDPSGITNVSVAPRTFGFCDIGLRQILVGLTDSAGNTTNRTGPLRVLPTIEAPKTVYVDATYPATCGRVGFPNGTSDHNLWVGLNAFSRIQDAVDHVAEDGVVYVTGGRYQENVVINKPLFLLGPNVGVPGDALQRRPEAKVIPARSDPENAPIISVESDQVVIDGFLLDGSNPSLSGGYNANGVLVHAAAGVQNGTYPNLADVERITLRNNIITNISYDGICLDRYQYFGTSSAWNYIRHNKLANMWEGILTYSMDSVIANNVISNVTHGLGVHCVTTPAPKGFQPLVASNTLTIAQWWPVEIQAARAPGIWINFRQEQASPIAVVANVITTPTAAPNLKTILGLYALTVEPGRKVEFIDNSVFGRSNCTVGLLAANCPGKHSVRLRGGLLKDIRSTGVMADTLDAKWGNADCSVTVSNATIKMIPGGVGVLAVQENPTPTNSAFAEIIGDSNIRGGTCGVQARGPNAALSIVGTRQLISGNDVGIYVNGGRALLEGNILCGNRTAAIRVENGAVVDAGDCSGENVSHLGTGSGSNGASAGLNDFTGYGCDNAAPWAITNSGKVPVVADRNFFGPKPGEDIRGAFCGAVRFSAAGLLNAQAPPAVQVECLTQVPPAARTVAEFIAAGGAVTAGQAIALSSQDITITNRTGHYVVTRTYLLSGGCDQVLSCSQIIVARDDQGPTLLCSSGIVQRVDPGCDYATVTFTNLAADSCGELLGSWVPVSTGRFPIGTNTIIVVATDLAYNSTACSFDIAVIGPPKLAQKPLTNLLKAGSGGDKRKIMPFHPEEAANRGNLRIVELSGLIVTLALDGPQVGQFAIQTSTNLTQWAGLQTNSAPFILRHTNTSGGYRFYRAQKLPDL